jgi:hypothetical protein
MSIGRCQKCEGKDVLGADMHVIVISIGPVQEFIASARKCRDLWFGKIGR